MQVEPLGHERQDEEPDLVGQAADVCFFNTRALALLLHGVVFFSCRTHRWDVRDGCDPPDGLPARHSDGLRGVRVGSGGAGDAQV